MPGKSSKRNRNKAEHQAAEQWAVAQPSSGQPTSGQSAPGQAVPGQLPPDQSASGQQVAAQPLTKKEKRQLKKDQKNSKVLPTFCNIVGTVLLLAVIGLCVPLTVPRVLGYEVYDVISGSMEPEIPLGSVIYVKHADPADIKEGEVIAYNDGTGVIAHRVTTNRTSVGEFVTKGDANNIEDINPVPYDAVVGRVETSVPMMGAFMALYASTVGKVYLLLTAACGVMLNILASRIREVRRIRARRAAAQVVGVTDTGGASVAAAVAAGGAGGAGAAGAGASGAGGTWAAGVAGAGAAGAVSPGALGPDGQPLGQVAVGPDGQPLNAASAAQGATQGANVPANWQASVAAEAAAAQAQTQARKKRSKSAFSFLKGALVIVLATVFLGSAGVVGYVMWQYSVSDALYSEARSDFVKLSGDATGEKPPIEVDFDDLLKKNPDIVGWIYCEDTPINYPVLHGKDNDQYLHTDYTGTYNFDGSIFVDYENSRGFVDSNTIVYGHHMNSGSMFASLVKWADQAYYDKHPVMWLLTPTQNYKVVLFSGHHVSAFSHMYDIIQQPCRKMDVLLARALVESDFKTDAYFKTTPNIVSLASAGDAGFDEMEAMEQAAVDAANEAANLAASPTATREEIAAAQATAQAAAQAVTTDNSGRTIIGKESADGIKIESDAQYVMLSTCAYLFDNDRYVLHGLLQPV